MTKEGTVILKRGPVRRKIPGRVYNRTRSPGRRRGSLAPPRISGLPIKLFISYAHEDECPRGRLEKHLALLKNTGLINIWHRGLTLPGEERDKRISASLESADVVLLLVSPDFIASDSCGQEVIWAMERRKVRQVWVMPVIVRACAWQDASFGQLEPSPKNGRPVLSWKDQDEAWLEVTQDLNKVIMVIKEQAEMITEQAEAGRSDDPDDIGLGGALFKQGKFEEAETHYRQARDLERSEESGTVEPPPATTS